MPVKHKYTFLCLLVVCVTILCFIWIVQDRLKELSIKEKQRITGGPCLRIREVNNSARGRNPPHFNQLERLVCRHPHYS